MLQLIFFRSDNYLPASPRTSKTTVKVIIEASSLPRKFFSHAFYRPLAAAAWLVCLTLFNLKQINPKCPYHKLCKLLLAFGWKHKTFSFYDLTMKPSWRGHYLAGLTNYLCNISNKIYVLLLNKWNKLLSWNWKLYHGTNVKAVPWFVWLLTPRKGLHWR